MRTLLIVLALLTLAACASTQERSTQSWNDYRKQVIAQRDAGKITPVEAQELLRAKYHAMYGDDQKMDGYFAYSVNLLRSAEAGKLPMSEAEAIVSAREQELITQRESQPAVSTVYWDRQQPTDTSY
jgi:uncharacterized protein YcfL